MAAFEEDRLVAVFQLGVGTALGLIAYGYAHHPHSSLASISAATVILIGYGVLGFASRRTQWLANLRPAGVAGLATGAVFAAEILLEYLFLPENNVLWGYVEFGLVFLIYTLVAVWVAWQNRSISDAVRAAFATAIIGSLIWCIVLLSAFYAYEGTASQTAVLIAEGEPQDFLRSGMSDYPTFLMEDLFGATFFHLLLGPAIAALLGLISSSSIAAFRRLSGSARA